MAAESSRRWWLRAGVGAGDPTGWDWSPGAGALRFPLIMLLSVGLATVATVASARAVLPPEVWQEAGFSRQEAVQVVSARFGTSIAGRQLRRNLRMNAQVEYHSPYRWTVRLGEASWIAHGEDGTGPDGRYAEPDNEAARRLEAEAAGS